MSGVPEPTSKHQTAGVIAPPPLIYLFFLGMGLIVYWHIGWPIRPQEIATPAGWVLIGLSIVMMILAVLAQWKLSTSVTPYTPTTALAVRGIYAWTRNPIYL